MSTYFLDKAILFDFYKLKTQGTQLHEVVVRIR